MAVKILTMAGSLREDSYNKKLIRVAAEVTVLDLKEYPLPVCDGGLGILRP